MAGSGHRLLRAAPREAARLEELQSRSASHWGYPEGYFDWAGDARRIPESYVRDNPVLVLVDGDGRGRTLGFYAFIEGDDLLLDKMFVDVDQIGTGLGRVLWVHAVQTARDLGASAFVIGADPNAAPFYEAMAPSGTPRGRPRSRPGPSRCTATRCRRPPGADPGLIRG